MMRFELMLALFLAAAAPAAGAEGNPATAPAETCPICQAKDEFNKLIPGVKWGGDLRLRVMYDNNIKKLDKEAPGHERFWSRYRARVWTSITPIENLEFNIRLTGEPQYYTRPRTMDKQFINHEALFDEFNIQWSKAFGLPLKLKVGRQDIKLGDGWLTADGTPLDGTRTVFFDAARATWDAADIKTTFDLIGIRNRANSSYFIRPFNDRGIDIAEHDSTGVILYASNQSIEKTTIDGYFIYKHDDRVVASGSNSDIYTLGARASGQADDHWKYRAELAPQWGQKNGVEIRALGANGQMSYYLNDRLDNYFPFDYEYRSGDRKRDGAFDMLWGRTTHWSNVYVDSLSSLENLPSLATNLHRVAVGWGCSPTKKATLETKYHLLFRDRNTFAGTKGFSDKGVFRGQLLTVTLKHKLTEHLSTALLTELFLPGNYYDDSRNDAAVYVRYEIMLTW